MKHYCYFVNKMTMMGHIKETTPNTSRYHKDTATFLAKSIDIEEYITWLPVIRVWVNRIIISSKVM